MGRPKKNITEKSTGKRGRPAGTAKTGGALSEMLKLSLNQTDILTKLGQMESNIFKIVEQFNGVLAKMNEEIRILEQKHRPVPTPAAKNDNGPSYTNAADPMYAAQGLSEVEAE